MGKRKGVAAGMAAALGVAVTQLFGGTAAARPPANHGVASGRPIVAPPGKVPVPVPVPTVTVPTVTVPTVTVPPAPAPTPVPTPAPAPTPPVTTPKVVSSPLHGATSQPPSSSRHTHAGAPAVTPAPAPVPTPAPAPKTTPAVQHSPSAAAGSSTTPTAAAPAVSHASAARSHARRSRHHQARAHRKASAPAISPQTRRLRLVVTRLRGCLPALDPASRRLLSLRAGLGAGARPLAPLATARVLRIGLGRERLLERLALMGLERSAATGCAGAAAASGGATTGSPAAAVSGSTLTPGAPWMGGAVPAANTNPAGSVSAAQAQRPQVNVTRRVASHGVERAGAADESFPVAAIPAFATLLIGVCLVALPGVRRRLLSPPRQAGR